MSENNQQPCSSCSNVHSNNNLLNEVISALMPSPYMIPSEYISHRPRNDAFWEKLNNGPDKDILKDVSLDDNLDDLLTIFSNDWFTAIQSMTNMLVILDKIVKKYNITAGERNPNIPIGIYNIFETGEAILTTEKELTGLKKIFFEIYEIRKDWGSFDAYANAPEEKRTDWLNNRRTGTLERMFLDAITHYALNHSNVSLD